MCEREAEGQELLEACVIMTHARFTGTIVFCHSQSEGDTGRKMSIVYRIF